MSTPMRRRGSRPLLTTWFGVLIRASNNRCWLGEGCTSREFTVGCCREKGSQFSGDVFGGT